MVEIKKCPKCDKTDRVEYRGVVNEERTAIEDLILYCKRCKKEIWRRSRYEADEAVYMTNKLIAKAEERIKTGENKKKVFEDVKNLIQEFYKLNRHLLPERFETGSIETLAAQLGIEFEDKFTDEEALKIATEYLKKECEAFRTGIFVPKNIHRQDPIHNAGKKVSMEYSVVFTEFKQIGIYEYQNNDDINVYVHRNGIANLAFNVEFPKEYTKQIISKELEANIDQAKSLFVNVIAFVNKLNKKEVEENLTFFQPYKTQIYSQNIGRIIYFHNRLGDFEVGVGIKYISLEFRDRAKSSTKIGKRDALKIAKDFLKRFYSNFENRKFEIDIDKIESGSYYDREDRPEVYRIIFKEKPLAGEVSIYRNVLRLEVSLNGFINKYSGTDVWLRRTTPPKISKEEAIKKFKKYFARHKPSVSRVELEEKILDKGRKHTTVWRITGTEFDMGVDHPGHGGYVEVDADTGKIVSTFSPLC